MWGFFVSYDRERKQAYQTRVDGVAQVDDILHEERGSGDVAWAWWPDKYKVVVADVVIKQWTEARWLWSIVGKEENLNGGDGCADGGCCTASRRRRAGRLGPPGMRPTTVEMTRGRCSPSFGR